MKWSLPLGNSQFRERINVSKPAAMIQNEKCWRGRVRDGLSGCAVEWSKLVSDLKITRIGVSERNMDVLQQSISLIHISYFSLASWTPQTVY